MAKASASRRAALGKLAADREPPRADSSAREFPGQHPLPRPEMQVLVAEHHAAVYRYAQRLSGCPAHAEDLTQQTFLIAQQKLDQLRDPERSCGWLLAIARNCFLKSRRRTEPATAEAIGLNIDLVPSAPASDWLDREALSAALAELPDEFRLVLLMFYFESLSYQEIAAQLGLPLGTVMSRLARAKGRLRARLEPPAGEPSQPLTRSPLSQTAPSFPAAAIR